MYSFIYFINSTYIKLYQKILKEHWVFLFYNMVHKKSLYASKVLDSEAAGRTLRLFVEASLKFTVVKKERIISTHMALHHR